MNIGEARSRPYLEPVYLVEITLGNSGPTLYLSERNISAGGQLYEAYLKDLSGISNQAGRSTRKIPASPVQIILLNDEFKTYNYLAGIGDTYPFEGAGCVIKEAYMDDSGSASDSVVLFKGIITAVREIGLSEFTCEAVSMPFAMESFWRQGVINLSDYPNACEDLGKTEPVIYGSDILVPALRIDWGAKTTLVADIDALVTSIELSDASRFPASGTLIVDDEEINYAFKNGNMVSGCVRGANATAASPHRAGADTGEKRSRYDSLLAGHELQSVGDIFAELDGHLLRVTSGVTSVLEGGKQKLRATRQVGLKPVKDNIGLAEASHTHGSSTTKVYRPASASHNSLGNVTWSGTDSNVIDQSDSTYLKAVTSSVGLYSGSVTVNFPAYTGPQAARVYLCVSHHVELNYPGVNEYVKASANSVQNTLYYYQVGDSSRTTQKFDVTIGSSVPASAVISFSSDSHVVTCQIFEVWLEIESDSTGSALSGVSKTGGLAATRFIDRFHAVVSGYKDPDGSYGGQGTVIERPDHVIRHFLKTRSIFAGADIDLASFSQAGAAYAGYVPAGYKLAFSINREISPWEFLQEAAFECRSALSCTGGLWRLTAVPDASPAPVKTISGGELAKGAGGFVFRKRDIQEMMNSIILRFGSAYTVPGTRSPWLQTLSASDPASIAKYGELSRTLDFECVRDTATAQSVLDHILLERKELHITAVFPVFWEHFDLDPGDTVQIDSPLFGGRKLFIEKVERASRAVCLIEALEWW